VIGQNVLGVANVEEVEAGVDRDGGGDPSVVRLRPLPNHKLLEKFFVNSRESLLQINNKETSVQLSSLTRVRMALLAPLCRLANTFECP
jgi:hypothetical protein